MNQVDPQLIAFLSANAPAVVVTDELLGLAENLLLAFPQSPPILQIAGVLRARTGQWQRAADALKSALALDGSLPHARVFLVQSLEELGDFNAAIGVLFQAVMANSRDQASNTDFLRLLKAFPDSPALREYLRLWCAVCGVDIAAPRLDALFPDAERRRAAWRNLSQLLLTTGHTEEAIAAFHSSTLPADGGRVDVGAQYSGMGETYEDNAAHLTIARSFADFCRRNSVGPSLGRVLDAACGTGLVGAALADAADQFVGLDISPDMLAKAQAKNLYARLFTADLRAEFSAAAEDRFDTILCSAALNYFDDLAFFFAGAAERLGDGGQVFLSVDPCSDEAEVRSLDGTGEFCFSRRYIGRLATEHGFVVKQTDVASYRGYPGFYVQLMRTVPGV